MNKKTLKEFVQSHRGALIAAVVLIFGTLGLVSVVPKGHQGQAQAQLVDKMLSCSTVERQHEEMVSRFQKQIEELREENRTLEAQNGQLKKRADNTKAKTSYKKSVKRVAQR